jgi:hypothetical protein
VYECFPAGLRTENKIRIFIFQKFFIECFPAGRSTNKIRIYTHFAVDLSSKKVWTFLDIWKMLKWILYFSKILHWKFSRSGSSQKNKNQGTFRFWFVVWRSVKFLYISKVFKNRFFIFQNFFVWMFARRAQNRKNRIKIHFTFDLLLEEVCKLLDI